jgi:hypothetical protein
MTFCMNNLRFNNWFIKMGEWTVPRAGSPVHTCPKPGGPMAAAFLFIGGIYHFAFAVLHLFFREDIQLSMLFEGIVSGDAEWKSSI